MNRIVKRWSKGRKETKALASTGRGNTSGNGPSLQPQGRKTNNKCMRPLCRKDNRFRVIYSHCLEHHLGVKGAYISTNNRVDDIPDTPRREASFQTLILGSS